MDIGAYITRAIKNTRREVDDVCVDDRDVAEISEFVECYGEEDVCYGSTCHPSMRSLVQPHEET